MSRTERKGYDLGGMYLRNTRGISLGRFHGRLHAIEPYPVTRKRKAEWRANDYLVDETSTFDVFPSVIRTHTLILVTLFKSYSRHSRISFWKKMSSMPRNVPIRRKSTHRSRALLCIATFPNVINKVSIIIDKITRYKVTCSTISRENADFFIIY